MRFGIGFLAGLAAVYLCINHLSMGMKGGVVPLPDVARCVVVASITTLLTAYAWHWLPAPFAGGIAGAFMVGPFASPYGGLLGLMVGTAIVAFTFSFHRPKGAKQASPGQSEVATPMSAALAREPRTQ